MNSSGNRRLCPPEEASLNMNPSSHPLVPPYHHHHHDQSRGISKDGVVHLESKCDLDVEASPSQEYSVNPPYTGAPSALSKALDKPDETRILRCRSSLNRRPAAATSGRPNAAACGRPTWHPQRRRPSWLSCRRTALFLTFAVFLMVDLLLVSSFVEAKKKKEKKKNSVDEAKIKSKCSVCRGLVTKFMEGLEKTKKSGYGGGNTAWEEKSLGKNSFSKSETRFIEVMERVCDDVSGETDKFYCGNIIEEHEEDIEEWYQSDQEALLEQVLCVEALKVCCPYGSFGAACTPCANATSVFCNGRGECKGNGTRVGSGKCDCQWPYKGSSCDECHSGYFQDELHSNETHRICEKCNDACGVGGCKGPEALHCVDCAKGYKLDKKEEDEEAKGCVDIDECEENPCSRSEFCRNSVGSHSCEKCDQICHPDHGCTGGGASACVECRDGAELDADRKNCVVTDWTKYDESLKKEKEEEGDGEEEEEEEGEEEKEEEEDTEEDPGAKSIVEELKEKKAKLQKELGFKDEL